MVDDAIAPKRADAARNRQAILEAAGRLLAESEVGNVSIEEIAAAAGVGKGTVFHRFGSRAGLLRALVLERAQELRRAVVSGDPPLGPGASAPERLLAYFEAMSTLVVENAGLAAAYDAATEDKQTDEIHAFWYRHIADLLQEARPDLDADLTSRLLLGALGSHHVLHLARAGQGERVKASVLDLVRSVVPAK